MTEDEARLRVVAQAIWDGGLAEHEDDCDLKIEDLGAGHVVWSAARLVVACLDHELTDDAAARCSLPDLVWRRALIGADSELDAWERRAVAEALWRAEPGITLGALKEEVRLEVELAGQEDD